MSGSEEDRLRFIQNEHERQAAKDRALIEADRLEGVVPLTVALVGCSKQKRASSAGLPAQELYAGRLFRMAFEYAKNTADDVHILSALHGLVAPHQILVPYDLSIMELLLHEQDDWGIKIVDTLFFAYPLTPLRLIFYAGYQYIRPVLKAAQNQEAYWSWETPLEGLDLFARIRWFKEHRENS